VVNEQLVALLRSRPVLRSAHFSTPTAPEDAEVLLTPTGPLKQLRAELHSLCERAGRRKVVDPPEHVVKLLMHYEAISTFDCLDAMHDVLTRYGSLSSYFAKDLPQALLLRILLAVLHWAGKTFNHDQLQEAGWAGAGCGLAAHHLRARDDRAGLRSEGRPSSFARSSPRSAGDPFGGHEALWKRSWVHLASLTVLRPEAADHLGGRGGRSEAH
ncbi:unnamed protein product, partial [Effrenium voratum]